LTFHMWEYLMGYYTHFTPIEEKTKGWSKWECIILQLNECAFKIYELMAPLEVRLWSRYGAKRTF
jgi:hypothetical protein